MSCQRIVFTVFFAACAIFCDTTAAPPKFEKILGGWNANPGEFPYQVSLRVNGAHTCGGAIISDLHILTAAHCVQGFVNFPYQNAVVVSGSNKLSQGGQIHQICRVTIHPEYTPGAEYSWHNDIAIITLNKPLTLNPYQQVINIPKRNLSYGSSGLIAGWGLVFTNYRVTPDDLQKLPTSVYPSSICQSRFGNLMFEEQICAIQTVGRGACSGDSGGPLVVNGEVVGIASWVVPCGRGFPDVYTNVFSYKNFIEQEMNLTRLYFTNAIC